MEEIAISHGTRTLPEKSPRHPAKKGMTFGVYPYLWWGMGHGKLFSWILVDLVGRKTSGQKGTDSIKWASARQCLL